MLRMLPLVPTGVRQLKEVEANVKCAWCNKELRHDPDLPPGEVSHGICKQCAKTYFGK
jgi:hypothetical protein